MKTLLKGNDRVFIDANGDSPPNTIGKDICAAVFTNDGLVPAGNDESAETVDQNCNAESTAENAGYFCLLKVKNNGRVIPQEVRDRKN